MASPKKPAPEPNAVAVILTIDFKELRRWKHFLLYRLSLNRDEVEPMIEFLDHIQKRAIASGKTSVEVYG